jgi:hypothetical protein
MNTYPLDWVRLAAHQVYGRPLGDRAWRKWLRVCQVPQWSREADTDQATLLLTLAYLKRQHPRKAIGIVHLKQQLKTGPVSEVWLKEQVEQAFYTQATGKDLPHLLRQVTGKRVTLRTLYRWARKHRLQFGASQPIPRSEIQRWIDIAS